MIKICEIGYTNKRRKPGVNGSIQMNVRQTVARIALLIPVLFLSARTMAQCDDWRAGPLHPVPGMNDDVRALTTWDPDGTGVVPPRLIAGGYFSAAGTLNALRAASWDGSAWSALGSGLSSEGLTSMTTWDPDGAGPAVAQPVAAGAFMTAGGVTVHGVARWDGSGWQPFGAGITSSGIDSYATAVTSWDPDGPGPQAPHLVIGGGFTQVGGVNANGIAHWNGTSWLPFGTGLAPLGHTVGALTVWDPDGTGPLPGELVVGGNFATAGGTVVNGIARWDGAAWQPFGSGTGGIVEALTTWDPDGAGPLPAQLVAGGYFYMNGGEQGVVRWDGAAWQPAGSGITLASNGLDQITTLTTWDPDGSGPLPPVLIAAGRFAGGGDVAGTNIAAWDGTSWKALGEGFDNIVYSLTTSDSGRSGSIPARLVAGGYFLNSGGLRVNRIAQWNGLGWEAFVPPFASPPRVTALTQFGNRMVAAGEFRADAADVTSFTGAANIVAWDGRHMTSLGTGVNGSVRALKSYTAGTLALPTNNLIVGGVFTTAGGNAVNNIARWTEGGLIADSGWHAMGAGLNNIVYAVERFNASIYAGGDFTASGATNVNHIARYDGTNWQPVGTGAVTGVNGTVWALKAYSNGVTVLSLAVGGQFTTAGGNAAHNIAVFTQSSLTGSSVWSTFGGGFNDTVFAIERFNNATYAAGNFTASGATTLNHVARWDGTAWQPLGLGLNGPVYSMLSENGFLYAGGPFTATGTSIRNHLARWDGTTWSDVRGGADHTIFSLAAFHNEAHAGGIFDSVRGASVPSPGWARYLETGAPWVVDQPQSVAKACNARVSFTSRAAKGYSLIYTWRHNGVPLSDGPTGTGSIIRGIGNATIDIDNISAADEGTYDIVFSNACGSGTSDPATLTISGGTGNGDGDGNGVADGQDIAGFVTMVITGVSQGRGICAYDMNADGVVDSADLPLFVARLLHA